MHKIFPLTGSMWYQHSDYMWLSTFNSFIDFGFTQVKTKAIIFGRLMFFTSLLQSKLLQSICCTETVISFSFLYEVTTIKLLPKVKLWWSLDICATDETEYKVRAVHRSSHCFSKKQLIGVLLPIPFHSIWACLLSSGLTQEPHESKINVSFILPLTLSVSSILSKNLPLLTFAKR